MRTFTSRALALMLLLVAGCRDLGVPEPPEKGGVTGRVVGNDDAPLDQVAVELSPEFGEPLGTTSDATGAFSFTGVEPGRYVVRASAPNRVEQQRAVTVVAKTTRDVGTLKLYSLQQPSDDDGTITGQVQVMSGGDPLGAEVTFREAATDQKVAIATIGASGEFVQKLPPGDWKLTATHPLYTASQTLMVTLLPKQIAPLPMPLQLTINPGRIQGKVRLELDRSVATLPANGAVVTSDTSVSVTVDAMGNFDLGGLAGGLRRVRITLPGYHDALVEHLVSVTPGMSSTLPDVVLLLDRGDIQGEVEMGDNTPLVDVTASLAFTAPDAGTNPYAAQVSAAGARGSYLIRAVPVGQYAVRAVRNNYIAATSAPLMVTAGGTAAADLLRLFRVQGDFEIDDGDATNTPGFTRTANLTLRLSNAGSPAEYRVSESASGLSSASWQPFTSMITPSSIPFTLATGDGTHTIYIQYRDAQMNQSGVLSGSVVLDTVAPVPDAVGGVVIEGGAAFTRQNVRFSVSVGASDPRGMAVDNVSGLASVRLATSGTLDGQGRLGGAAKPYAPLLQFDRLVTTDGVETVFAQFVDNAGNASTVIVNDQITVDTVPPTGTMTISRGLKASANGFTNDPAVRLQFAVGNEPDGGYVEVQRANDDVLGLQGAVLQRVTPTMQWGLTPTEGSRTVHYRLVDAAGNQAMASSQAIVLDTTPPTATLALATPGPQNTLTVSLTASANDSNGLSTTAALALSDDSTFTSTSTVSFMSLPSSPTFTLQAGDGVRSVHGRFRDVAGNDAVTALSFVLDTRAPAGSIVVEGALADGSASQALTSATSVTVRMQPDDAVEYVVGTEALTVCPTSGYLPLPMTLALTNHPLTSSGVVNVCFRDAARNTKLVTDSIAIDSAAPTGCTLALTGVFANGTSSGSMKTARPGITVTATGCGDATEMFLTEGTPTCTAMAANAWSTFRGSQSFTLSGVEGPVTVRGCVRDAARNTTSVNAASITLDTTPPTGGSVVINADATWVNASQVSGGTTTFNITGGATGAVRWAVGTTPGSTGFAAVAPVSLPVSVPTDGRYAVYAVFEDDMGNTTQNVISDTILVDATPPTVAGLTLRAFSTGAAGWTGTETITVQVGPTLPDAVTVQVAERLGSTSCSAADFSVAPLQPVTSSSVFVLAPSEGPRRVCVRYRDAAGNDSIGGSPVGILEAAITLDKTPPTTPQIVTANASVRLGRGAPQAVDIATPSTDALSFRSYQQLGGLFSDGGVVSAWTDVSPSGPATRFTFRLDNDGSEFGSRNELRLRATDSAGNASGESVVFFTADTNAPPNVEAEQLWVDNTNGQASAWFRRPIDAGVAGYHVYYSSTPDFLDVNVATFAAEGPSPLTLNDQPVINTLVDGGTALPVQSVTLSGLPNGSPTYVRVRAFDEAGNEEGDGGSVWVNVDGGTRQPLQLQPNEVSSNEIASLVLPSPGSTVHRLAMKDDVLYVLAGTAFCTLTTGSNLDYFLHAVDLNGLAAPIQNGNLEGPRVAPTVASTTQLTGNTTTCDLTTSNADLLIEGTWAYVITPSRLFILNIAEPYAPVLYTSIDLTGASVGAGFRAQSMCSYGERLGIAGRAGSVSGTFSTLWNLAELYDRNSSTVPSAADRYTAATLSTTTVLPDSLFFTQDRLVSMGPSGSTNFLYRFDLGPTFAAAPAAPVYEGLLGNTFFPMAPRTRPPVSGNYAYFASNFSGLSSFRLNNVWSGSDPTVSLSTAWTAEGPIDVLGHLVFSADPDRRALRITDVSSATLPRSVGLNSFNSNLADGVVAYGNYAIAVSGSTLRFYEVATPRAVTSIATEPLGGTSAEVRGGFLFTGGRVFDLQASQIISPTWPSSTGPVSTSCFNGSAFGDRFEVNGRGDGFVTRDLESSMDRTTATPEAGGNTVTLAGSRVTDVALTGNHLIVAELRAAGLYLEVFDVRRLRNRQGTLMGTTDSIGAVQVVAAASLPTTQAVANLTAKISVSHTRVAIGLDYNLPNSSPPTTPGNYLYFVELKSLLDDDAASAPIVHPVVQISPVRQVVMANDTAYVATNAGVRALDISAVMDNNAGTTLVSPTVYSLVDNTPFASVFISGSTLLAAPSFTASPTSRLGVYAVNVASIAVPQIIGFYPYAPGDGQCFAVGDTANRRIHGRITVAGSRAYFATPPGSVEVLKLE